jgi:hypothetical protein
MLEESHEEKRMDKGLPTILHNIFNSTTGNHTLCILKVMSPKWPNFVLTADIPNCKTYVLVFHCFYVKTWGHKFQIMSKNNSC